VKRTTSVPIISRLEPFKPEWTYAVPEGLTLLEIVERVPNLPAAFVHHGEVLVNGKRWRRAMWKSVRPTAMAVVTLQLMPGIGGAGGGGGGGGGQKNVALTMAAIVILAGTIFIGAGGIAALAGLPATSTWAAGGLGAQLAAGLFGAAGAFALQALAPPPYSPKAPATTGRDSGSDPLSQAGITGNGVKIGDELPAVLGLLQYSPPLGSPSFTTLQNGVVYAHATYLLAGYYDVSNILLNGVPIGEFATVQYEVRDGAPGNSLLTLNNKTFIEKRNQNALLTNFVLEGEDSRGNKLVHQSNPDQDLPQWQVFKTAGPADEIRIRIFIPALQWTDDTNTVPPETGVVPVRVEIRERGTFTWLKMPVIHFRSHKLNQQLRQEIRLIWVADPGGARINFKRGLHTFGAYHTTGDGQAFEYNSESYFLQPAIVDQIPVMTAATTSGVTMSASNQVVGNEAWRAGDNSALTTYWIASSASLPQWNKVDFGAAGARIIKSMMISPRFADDGAPEDFTVQGSNDNAIFDVLLTVEGYTRWKDDDEPDPATFQFDTFGSYRYYRIHVTKTIDGGPANLLDWQLFLHDAPGTSEFHENNPADIFASNCNLHDDGIDIFLDPATFPKGEYEVRVKRGLGVIENQFNEEQYTYSASAVNANFFGYYDDAGIKKVRQTQATVASETFLESFTTIENVYPFDPSIHQKGVAMITLVAPSMTIESLSASFHSIVPVYQDGTWSTLAPSSNPAALFRHVALGKENVKALPGEIVDEENLQAFWARCVAAGFECNFVADGMSAEQILQVIAAAGWAVPKRAGLWGVMMEYDRSGDAIQQLFTSRNCKSYGHSIDFPDAIHAIRAEYSNEDNDYAPDEVIVYAPGYNIDNAVNIVAVKYLGITNTDKVADRALLDIRQMIYRSVTSEIEVPAEGICSAAGDLVGLNDDVLVKHHGACLIEAVLLDGGGNITGLVLEAEIDFGAAAGEIEERMMAAIRTMPAAGPPAVIMAEIDEQTETDTVTFTTPIPPDATVKAGGLVAFGVYDQVVVRKRIFEIARGRGKTHRLRLKDDASELIHAA